MKLPARQRERERPPKAALLLGREPASGDAAVAAQWCDPPPQTEHGFILDASAGHEMVSGAKQGAEGGKQLSMSPSSVPGTFE